MKQILKTEKIEAQSYTLKQLWFNLTLKFLEPKTKSVMDKIDHHKYIESKQS